MLDGVEIERAGLPAAVIITHEFGATAQTMLESQGAPWFKYAEVPHPINILDDEQAGKVAAAVVEDLVELLTEG